MLADLIRVATRDGYYLDGMIQQPTAVTTIGLDAICMVHGTGGNFYSSSLFETLGQHFLEHGCAVVRVNTRGHDGISTVVRSGGGARLGAAFETVDDCRHDLAAWMDWMRKNLGWRLAWLGHSLGAVKCLYAAVHEPQSAPQSLIALSPPRLSYSWFCDGPRGQEFLAIYHQAESLVNAGQAGALVDVQLPLPMVIAAAGYVDKYGPNERYNYLQFLPSVPCPTLVMVGSVEVAENIAFQEVPPVVAKMAELQSRLSLATVEGADHFYAGVREEAWRTIEAWLAGVKV